MYTSKKNRKWTEEEIQLLQINYPVRGAMYCARLLNRNRGSINKKVTQLNIVKCRGKILFTKEELEIAVKKSLTYSELCDNLDKSKSSGTYKVLRKYIIMYNIDVSHFNAGHVWKKNLENRVVKTIDEWLQYGSGISSFHLKNKLYNHELKKRKCEKCGQEEIWNGEKMSLILDHINGDNKDNRLENLRIVCPNCAATLPTHCRGYKKKHE